MRVGTIMHHQLYQSCSAYHERVRWRSPSEIGFRFGQEVRNLALFARPPRLPEHVKPRAPFLDPGPAIQALRQTSSAEAIAAWADQIVLHRFPLLGLEIDTGQSVVDTRRRRMGPAP